MKLLTKVHLLYCSCYVKQQYVDDDDNEPLSLCVNASRSKIARVVDDRWVPPASRIAAEEAGISRSGSAAGSQPFLCDASPVVQHSWWCDWAPDGLPTKPVSLFCSPWKLSPSAFHLYAKEKRKLFHMWEENVIAVGRR